MDVVSKVAARFDRDPCADYLATGGVGHGFVLRAVSFDYRQSVMLAGGHGFGLRGRDTLIFSVRAPGVTRDRGAASAGVPRGGAVKWGRRRWDGVGASEWRGMGSRRQRGALRSPAWALELYIKERECPTRQRPLVARIKASMWSR